MPSRRRVLATLPVAAALGGCSSRTDPGTGSRSPDPSPASDERPRPADPKHDAVDWRVDLPFAVRGLDVGDGAVAVTAADDGDGRLTGTSSAEAEREPAGGVGLLRDGEVAWYLKTTPPAAGAPRLGDGVAAVVGYSTGLHGVDQRLVRVVDGERRWESERVDDSLTVLAADDRRAYLATSDDALGIDGQRLFAVDDGGETAWSVESGDAFRGRLHRDRLLVDVGGVAVGGHDPATGDGAWRLTVAAVADAGGSPAVAGDLWFGRATETDEHGYPLAAHSLDGRRRWTYSRPAGRNFVPTGVAPTAEGPVGTEYGGLVFGLAADGAERWTADAAGPVREPPVAAGGVVYVGDAGGGVTALDAATGDEVWRRSVGAAATVAGATGDAVVVAGTLPPRTGGGGSRRRYVASLGAADGRPRWRFETGEDLLRPVVGDGTVYLGSASGAVRTLGA